MTEKELFEEFSDRVNRLRETGLVDFKVHLEPTKDTTVLSTIITLNNCLKMVEEGQFTPVDIR